MSSFRIVGRQAGFVAVVASLLLALVAPILASADEVTLRSVALSSSSKEATDVSYTVNFTTAKTGAQAFVVDFCDGPTIGAACTPPAGLDASGASSETTDFTDVAATASKVVVNRAANIAASTAVSVQLDGITNPDDTGTIYARILTFASDTLADAYTSEVPGTYIDSGSVAIAITDTIAVSGAVNESLLFCVSKTNITGTNCSAGVTAPTLELGETSGGVTALSSSAVSTADLFTQISTNAVSGAVVNLKSNAAGCGGLINSSDKNGCYIAPATTGTGITQGNALFGLVVNPGVDPNTGTNSSGTFQIANGASYTTSTYFMNYDSDDEATGVTSVFGDPILDTDGGPASNKNMKITFGASISNNTPAGKYSADLSLIATGKF